LLSAQTYAVYKALEVRIAPGLGSQSGPTFSVVEFIDARDEAIKAMYDEVIG
jgi:hypothetical protein